MAAIVKAVKDDDMLLKDLATSANDIVSRRRVYSGSTTQGPFSHRGNIYGAPAKVTFDILDSESFLDLRSLLLQAIFVPQFYRKMTAVPNYPTTAATGGIGYMKGSGPELDRTIDSLLVTLRIGNSAGLIIEDQQSYGVWCQILNSYENFYADPSKPLSGCGLNKPLNQYSNSQDVGSYYRSDNNANWLTSVAVDDTAAQTPGTLGTPVGGGKASAQRNITIPFSGSSFLNRVKLLPLFLLRSGLRLEVEFEDPRLAFWNNCGYEYVTSCTVVDNGSTTFQPNVNLCVGDIVLVYNTSATIATQTANPLGLPTYSFVVSTAVAAGAATAYATVFGANYLAGTLLCPTGASRTLYCDVIRPKGMNGVAPTAANFQLGVFPFNIASLDVPTDGDASNSGMFWSYGIQNPQLICDFIKPSSEIYADYLSRFKMPEGLNYSYDRILSQTITLSQIAQGQISVPLNFSVRSLKGIVFVLMDPIADQGIKSQNTQLNFPCKSAFMLRGLVSANLQIGGTQFPAYTLKFNGENVNGNVAETGLMMRSFSRSLDAWAEDRFGTDYARFQGILGSSVATNGVAGYNNGVAYYTHYRDTRDAVIGISTMKKDGGFMQGVDTTQSGNLMLNLTFSSNYPLNPYDNNATPAVAARNVTLRCYAIADAVYTLQESSAVVRF